MLTFSGRVFHPLDPHREDVEIADIAHALSLICRFGGHALKFYSEAQHRHLVSFMVPQHLALPALMHDTQRAYAGALVWPVKAALRRSSASGRSAFDAIEDHVAGAIRARFGLQRLVGTDAKAIEDAEVLALATERRDVMPESDHAWDVLEGIDPDEDVIVPCSPAAAQRLFLDRFESLTRRAA